MKIMVICSAAETIVWHRGELIKNMVELGNRVIALAPDDHRAWQNRVEQFGCEYRQIHMQKTGVNVFSDLKCKNNIKSMIEEYRPDSIFLYHAKAVNYGALAAHSAGIPEIHAMITGLGSTIRGDSLKCKVLRPIVCGLYRRSLQCCKTIFMQNPDDYGKLRELNVIDAGKPVTLVNGSGVNMEYFAKWDIPEENCFLFAGRLLHDKGIFEYLKAAEIAKKKHPQARFLIAGGTDTNPSAAKLEDLAPYIEQGIIEYLGKLDDMRPALRRCSVFVLPSYHEGTPKSVLEAMSTGRAIITTDAPGCRETVKNGHNGFLIPVMDVQALAERMIYMIENPQERKIMSENSYKMCLEKYEVKKVNSVVLKEMSLIEKADIPVKKIGAAYRQ